MPPGILLLALLLLPADALGIVVTFWTQNVVAGLGAAFGALVAEFALLWTYLRRTL